MRYKTENSNISFFLSLIFDDNPTIHLCLCSLCLWASEERSAETWCVARALVSATISPTRRSKSGQKEGLVVILLLGHY